MSSDLVEGRKYGRWTLVGYARNDRWRTPFWLCVCECGVEREVSARLLRCGLSMSCGCLQSELVSKRATTHGQWKSRAYSSWHGMLTRCLPTAAERTRSRYFDRGITVCERWRKFENFFEDMGHPPSGFELDRIDNDGGYSPENCRWVEHIRNCNNRSSCRMIEVDGVKKSLSDWARVCGVDREMMRGRIRLGNDAVDVVIGFLKRV